MRAVMLAQPQYVLPLLVPERQLVRAFPTAHNARATPYGQWQDFSKLVRYESELVGRRKLKMRPRKVIFVGDVAVGKTAIVNRFCYDKFQRSYKATIGVDFEIENFNILGQNLCFEMWDTAGQERFKCIAQAYYRNADVIVVVCDMTKPATLRAATAWLNDALAVNTLQQQPLIFLVGTKSDLLTREKFMRVEKEATAVAADMRAEYWSVSARTGYNVVRLFQRMAALSFEGAFREALTEQEHKERSISAQMHKKSQMFDFRKSFGYSSRCEAGRRSFCLC